MENVQNMEIFKDIKGYPDYQISNKGRVWNCKRQRYVAQHKNNRGYYMVHLNAVNGKRKTELVHRLVALTFIDNPNNLPEVEHKDRNRENNCVDNLCWISRSGNCRNTSQNRMLRVYKNGEFIKECCLTEAAEVIGVTPSAIYSYFYRQAKYINKIYTIESV